MCVEHVSYDGAIGMMLMSAIGPTSRAASSMSPPASSQVPHRDRTIVSVYNKLQPNHNPVKFLAHHLQWSEMVLSI